MTDHENHYDAIIDQKLYSDGAYTDQGAVRELLISLHDYYGLSWPKIAALRSLRRIPNSTLNSIAKTGHVPRKWWDYLRIKSDAPPRISISKVDVSSAFKSMTNNLDRSFIIKLWLELGDWLDEWN